MMATRHDGRAASQLRPLEIQREFRSAAAGSVLITAGRTAILCTASVEEKVPSWLEGSGKGWITAEYNMLPGSTQPRKPRERSGKVDGRTTEIQRFIGRSLRAVADLHAMGQRTLSVDCDVLEADGGTRTLSVTGGLIALVDALASCEFRARFPLLASVAAVSAGIVNGQPVLDLDYREDFSAAVDMNIVMTSTGRYVEIQGTGEEATFDESELASLLNLARHGINELIQQQRDALGDRWPWNDS